MEKLIDKINKIRSLISQMERHQNLNQSDMPLICEILKDELNYLTKLL
jgi:hypothetical protein